MKGQGWAERVKIDKRENNGKKTSVLKLFLSGTDCGCLSWKILTHKLRHVDKRDLEIQGRLRLQTQYLINFQSFDECHGNRCICILWDFIEFFYKTKFAQRNLLLSVKDKPVQIEKLWNGWRSVFYYHYISKYRRLLLFV